MEKYTTKNFYLCDADNDRKFREGNALDECCRRNQLCKVKDGIAQCVDRPKYDGNTVSCGIGENLCGPYSFYGNIINNGNQLLDGDRRWTIIRDKLYFCCPNGKQCLSPDQNQQTGACSTPADSPGQQPPTTQPSSEFSCPKTTCSRGNRKW